MNMRRLPIYVAIDCGVNMHPHYAKLIDVMAAFIDHARQDPWALDAMYMSFVAVGSHFEVVTPLRPLEEIHGIKVRPINNPADTGNFEEDMVRLFSTDLVRRRTEISMPDHYPRVLWISDGSHHEFAKRCSNPCHWERCGWFAWFYEMYCSVEEIVSIASQSSFWISNPFEDELLPDEEELVEQIYRYLRLSISSEY